MTIEDWRPVVGYEGIYEVSSVGRVRSLDRVVTFRNGRRRRHKGIQLRTWPIGECGHRGVGLSGHRGDKRRFLVHRLVAEAFFGPCPPGMECCHNNGDASDNRVVNLRWDTSSENKYDVVRHGAHHFAQRSHCKNGHKFTERNTFYRNGQPRARRCRTCAIENGRRLRERRRAAS